MVRINYAPEVLALLGSCAPLTLRIFVTALAIVDDLGAILVIALFYSAQITWTALAGVAGWIIISTTKSHAPAE